MDAVSKAAAEKEVDQWLNDIGVSSDQKEDLKTNVDILVNAVCTGNLTIDPKTNGLTQKLRKPFGKESIISELKFKTDISVSEINDFKKGIEKELDNRNMIAYVCASTGNLAAIIQQMNARDFNLSSAIVLFFVT